MLALLCIVQFIVVLDVTIVAVALPAIRRDLGFSTTGLTWVLTSYTLTFGGLLVLAGRLGDLLGHRRMLRTGLVGFAAASLACGVAASPAVLVGSRAVQGVGAALIAPTALALLGAAFPDGAGRRAAVGWWTASAAGGGASGWVLGGVLTQTVGWRAVFLVNLPVAAVAAAAAGRMLRETGRTARTRLDVAGAMLLTGGLTLVIWGLTTMQTDGAGARPAALVAAGVVALVALRRVERRASQPLLPPGALRAGPLPAAVGVSLVLTATTTPVMFLAILYQQDELGLGALATGLGTAPFNLAVILGSALGPRLCAWAGARLGMAGGLVLVAAGAGWLIRLGGDGSHLGYAVSLLPAFVLMGVGLGLAAVASTSSGTAPEPDQTPATGDDDRRGLASGLLNAAAQLGTVLGLALLVPLAAEVALRVESEVEGYRVGFGAAALVALVVAGWLVVRRAPPAVDEDSVRFPTGASTPAEPEVRPR